VKANDGLNSVAERFDTFTIGSWKWR